MSCKIVTAHSALSVHLPFLWSLTGWPCSCYCHQCNAWCCPGSSAFCSSWNNVSDICSHGQNNDKAPFNSLSSVAGLENALCEAWLSHRWTQGSGLPPSRPSPPGCLRHLHMVNPPARLFTKAKERHCFPFRARWLWGVVCSINKSSLRRLDRKVSFPPQWFHPVLIWRGSVAQGLCGYIWFQSGQHSALLKGGRNQGFKLVIDVCRDPTLVCASRIISGDCHLY